jgi:ribosomal protein S18 acetylase RimI-like enzyme
MINQELIQLFQELQYGIVFTRYIGLGFAKICYSEDDPSSYWNYAFTNQLLNSEQLLQLNNEFELLQRKPTIYFENTEDNTKLRTFLEENEFKKGFEDSWLFYGEDEINTNKFDQVKKVENVDELKTFVETFDKCYQKDDQQNPYGELGGYLNSARKAWIDYHDEKLEYFMVFKDGEPVAVSALTSYEGMGYIANVGSLQSVRGEGFGKLATLYCVWKSKENGNKNHFLGTEDGTYPNAFYQRIGFKKKFSTLGYSR